MPVNNPPSAVTAQQHESPAPGQSLPEPTYVGRIELEALAIEPGRTRPLRARLANGHTLLAIPGKKSATPAKEILPGRKLLLSCSPYDLSRGRIIRVS